MSIAVVFAYAVVDDVKPVVGAAPFDVLARQIPRALVTCLNGPDDRGVRFFPFLGPVDGQRDFLRLREQIEPKALLQLHKQGDVPLLVDGRLEQDALHWRVIDGDSGAVRVSLELPFDVLDPLAVLPRLAFELTGLLGWPGVPTPDSGLESAALGWFLVLKDEMLRREANLPSHAEDPLLAARRCAEAAGAHVEAQQLVLDYLALLLRRGQCRDEVAKAAAELQPHLTEAAKLDRLAGLMFAAGDEDRAVAVVVRAALLAPEQSELVERAAAMSFRAGDDDSVQAVVLAARRVDAATLSMIAQLAASYDRSGNLEGRKALVDELIGHEDLPLPVARLVVSFLLEEDQPALARTILETAIAKAPDQAMLHYELGRACLLLDDITAASVALQRSVDLGLSESVEGPAKRLLRLALVPGLWQGTQLVEKAISAKDYGAALGAVRVLLRRVGKVAEAWLMFGIVLQKLGKLRRAERALRLAVRCHDDCAEAHNRLGVVMLQLGRVEAGGVHLEKAHTLSPQDTSTLLHLAQASALSGRMELAEQQVQKAEQLGADPQLVQAVRREIRAA